MLHFLPRIRVYQCKRAEHLARKCENHNCQSTKLCVEFNSDSSPGIGSSQYQCIHFACPVPPAVNKATFIGTESLVNGSAAFYKCDGFYEPLNNKNFSTCSANGSWSEFKCKRHVRNCTELRHCQPSVVDGEYWLYPEKFGDKRVKIYCMNMLSSSNDSPKSYVTLNNETNAIHSYRLLHQHSTINYAKLGVDLQTMIIDPNDMAFSNPSINHYPPYGTVYRSCSLSYYPYTSSYLLINTIGTGLLLNKTAEWDDFSNNQPNSVILYVNKSSDHRIVNVSCSGECGECRPLHDLSFEYDETYEINMTDATDPACFD
ncbi:hypothetical protein LOTGIDRAFT_167205 [Lottia gigantea]|uniref:Sushi domain-containing protein n=1 Tax=Lottia gigantea TaxID=225164 RepID=V3ZPX8_LOTGI|nr:hypothetical protein LOTGIDRAFT_167205 [Lottia gigantea]ESO86382.1 hypothetical protein LOTGIDRAFT_167205 [Lottia gigantea]